MLSAAKENGDISNFLKSTQTYSEGACAALKKYAETTELADMTTEGLIQTSVNLKEKAEGIKNSFGANGLVGTIKNLGRSLLFAGANAAAMYVAVLGLQKAGEAIYNYFHKSELIIEKGQEAQKAIDEINQNKESTSSLVKDSGSTYAKLREKVGDLSAYSYLRDFFALKKE